MLALRAKCKRWQVKLLICFGDAVRINRHRVSGRAGVLYAPLWRSRVALINLLPSQIGIPLSASLRLNFQNFFISQLLLGLFMVCDPNFFSS